MNPGSGFGSGFGQQQPSVFGSGSGSGSGSATGFGTSTGPPPFGSVAQGFSSGISSTGNAGASGFGSSGSTGFGSSSSTSAGFGSTAGFGSPPSGAGAGNPVFGQSSGSLFSTSGSATSGFGSGSSVPVFGTSASSVTGTGTGFGTGTGTLGGGFGSGVSAFGASTAFGSSAGTTATASVGSTAPVFGSSFGTVPNVGGTIFSTAGSVFGMNKSSGDTASGFGSASKTSTFGVGISTGVGSGSQSFGQTTSVFGASTTKFSTGTSGFRTGGTSAFGTSVGGGFGGGSAVFGAVGPASTSATQPSAQPPSVFGSPARVGGTTSAPSTAGSTGSSVFGSKPGTAFGQAPSSVQGLGSGTGSIFSQTPASAAFGTLAGGAGSKSVFGSSATTPGFSGGTAGVSTTSPFGMVATSSVSSVFGGGTQAMPVFGASATVSGTAQTSSVTASGGSHAPAPLLPPPSYSASIAGSGGGQPNVFATPGASAVFGGPPVVSSTQGSVFGGAGKPVVKQETSFVSSTAHSNPETSRAGTSGGFTLQATGQEFSSGTGSSSVFGGVQANTKLSTSVPSSSASVFGGKTNFSPVFGGVNQPLVKTESAHSVFGGKQSSKVTDLPQQALFPTAANVSSADMVKDDSTKSKSAFTSQVKEIPRVQGVQAGASEQKVDTGGFHSARGKRTISRIGDQDSSGTSSIFGGKKGFAAGSSVFGGAHKGEPQSTFAFPVAPAPSASQKRSVGADDEAAEDASEAKRGRSEGPGQHSQSSSRTPEKMNIRRSSSLLEDVSSRTTIACKGVPANLNKVFLLQRHFSKFGKVKKVRTVLTKRYATIQFETHEAAARAKKHGTVLPEADKPLSIFWKAAASDKSPISPEESAAKSKFSWRRPKKEEPQFRGESSQRPAMSLPSSVAAELASMSGADSGSVSTVTQYQSRDRGPEVPKVDKESRQSRHKESSRRTKSKTPPPPPVLPSSTAVSIAETLVKQGKVDAASVSSLRKMVATTTMDKVSVLDTRDKLLRLKLGKQSGGGIHSQAFVGSCPDMCPEKERLYREEVRRLSIYEIIPGSSTLTGSTSLVDHTRAVKEYSRSSADQDEPLPHELRPLPVLTMTMNYLLVEIVDRGEDGKWAEWYDFLWNRTRSIRKEITQQQLCNQQVVDLLEKCVRFHVYCSERLCTEDMMVFDSKINDENLTKCLQTLKELYADMEDKHGLFCPCEAEFRAYIVLMNLNEGDTLREVQQLRPDVRGSPEIGFAVKAYTALNSNNYVRFFRLVKSASFLNGCILHRYFNQIRARAVQIILRSHTAGHKKVLFSLGELVRLLSFESGEEAREFCAYYGLRAQGSDLVLDRAAYVEPETSIPSWRAISLVESKRLVSVGQVINGGHLLPVQLPQPQCSFDEQGRFIGDLSSLTNGQESQDAVKPFSVKPVAKPPQLQPSPLHQVDTAGPSIVTEPVAAPPVQQVSAVPAAPAKPRGLQCDRETITIIAADVIRSVINEFSVSMAKSAIETQKMLQVILQAVGGTIVESAVSDLARQVCEEVVETERVHQSQLLAAEQREREQRVASEVVESVLHSVVDSQVLQIAQQQLQEAEAKDRAEREERCTAAVQSQLTEEVTGQLCLQVADQVYQEDVVQRLQLLAAQQKAVELKRTSQWLAVWRKALKMRQRQKRAMLDFPCGPSMRPARERLQAMFPDRPQHMSPLLPDRAALLVNHRASMTVLSPLEAEQRSLALTANLSLSSLVSSLQRGQAWQPLNLGSLLRAPLTQCLLQWPQQLVSDLRPHGVQWKLLLSMPGEMEMEDDGESDDDVGGGDDRSGTSRRGHKLLVLKQWLCAKFTHGEGSVSASDAKQKHVLSRYSTDLVTSTLIPARLRLGVCVRSVPEFSAEKKTDLPPPDLAQSITKGTSAVLFLLPFTDTEDDTRWLASRLRLARLLEAKPSQPPVPLVLLLPCSHQAPSTPTGQVTARLGVEGWQEKGLVSDVAVVELPVREGQPADVAVTSPVLQAQVSEAVKFLASAAPEPPQLRSQRVGDLVEDMTTQHFFTPVLQDLRRRQLHSKLHQAPNPIIDLYNSVLDHMAMALTSPALEDISWPVPELNRNTTSKEGVPSASWNSKAHLADIFQLVANLRLPWFQYQDSTASDWGQVCRDVWTFVNAVVDKRCDSAVSLTSRISRLLARTCVEFENMCSLTRSEDHCTPTYVNAPWVDIILACVDFRLLRLHNWKEEEEAVGGDTVVFYEEEDLEEFEPPASWSHAVLDTEDMETHKVEDTVDRSAILHFANTPVTEEDHLTTDNASHTTVHSRLEEDASAAHDSRSDKSLLEAAQDYQALPDNIRSALDVSEKLRLHMERERQQSQAFERYLEKALKGDTSPDMDISHIPLSHATPPVLQTPLLPSRTPSVPSRTPSGIRPAFGRGTPRSGLRGERDRFLEGQGMVLSDTLPGRPSACADVAGGVEEERRGEEGCSLDLPLSQCVDQLQEDLQAHKHANELFERRLQSLLES